MSAIGFSSHTQSERTLGKERELGGAGDGREPVEDGAGAMHRSVLVAVR